MNLGTQYLATADIVREPGPVVQFAGFDCTWVACYAEYAVHVDRRFELGLMASYCTLEEKLVVGRWTDADKARNRNTRRHYLQDSAIDT